MCLISVSSPATHPSSVNTIVFDQFFEFCHDDLVLLVGEFMVDVCSSSCLFLVGTLQRPVNRVALRHLLTHAEMNAPACDDYVVEMFRQVGVGGRVPETVLFVVPEIFHVCECLRV